MHGRASENGGREQIERNDALQGLRARQRRAVEQSLRIALAKAAHVDEAAAYQRQAGDAGQRLGRVVVARALEIFGSENADDFRGVAYFIRDEAALNDNFFGCFTRRRSGGLRLCIKGLRHNQRRSPEQQGFQSARGDFHCESAFLESERCGTGGKARASPPDAISKRFRLRGRMSSPHTNCRSGRRPHRHRSCSRRTKKPRSGWSGSERFRYRR